MPIPIPKPEQSKEDFMKVSEGMPQGQASAVCIAQWDKKGDKSKDDKPQKKSLINKAFFSAEVKQVDKEIEVTLSKQIRDRDGEIVDIKGGDLRNFSKNPIMLWGHRMIYGDVEDVMGHWENLRKTNDKILANPVFAEHPKAQYLKRMVEDGHVRSVSISFIVNDGGFNLESKTVKSWEMLEASWVTVPSNVEAVSNVKEFKKLDDELTEKQYRQLLNYKEIHPKIKQYRKLFMSEEFCGVLGFEKTGNELVDLKSIYDLIVSKLKETPKAEVKQETPAYVTRKDAIKMIEELVKSGII
ncbi:MAG TPA: HK97 family phage prohead protease [Paludibacteraceae bacterium]|nr:HK97 family phage prohead protease [Paludibacteraceae bacterium]